MSAALPEKAIASGWASKEEFLNFFRAVSIDIGKSELEDPGGARLKISDHEGFYELGLDSPYVHLWERSFSSNDPSLRESLKNPVNWRQVQY
ncbi:MAG: hypothetical protein AB1Z21_10725 [Synechococcaceae cyanobacterium]